MNEIVSNVNQFILGGDAQFTLYQEAMPGKKAVTVKYRVKRNDTGSCWFVYTELSDTSDMLSNGRKLVYQGYLKRDLQFYTGQKGRSDYNTVAVKGLLWLLHHTGNLPSTVHLYHHGRCSVCGRKLTDPESLRTGLGPTCRKKAGFSL